LREVCRLLSCDSRACAQEENILKEINAVDSEHNKNVHEDGRREFQLLRSTTRRDQPLRQYGSGNLFTLSRRARTRELLRITRPRHFESHGDLPGEPSDGEGGEGGDRPDGDEADPGGIAEQVRMFWESKYSAHVMKLAIVAPCPLDQLQLWVEACFGGIPRSDIRPLEGVAERFAAGNAQQHASMQAGAALRAFGEDWLSCYRIVPVKTTRALKMFFPIPPVAGGEARRDAADAKWRTKLERFLSFCMGHEGRGSILSLLKARGWATGLSAGTSFSTRIVAIFKIDVTLTPAGLAHWRAVEGVVMHYLTSCLRHDKTPRQRQRVFAEMCRAKEMRFSFMDRVHPGG
jgi:insulysin